MFQQFVHLLVICHDYYNELHALQLASVLVCPKQDLKEIYSYCNFLFHLYYLKMVNL